MQIQFAASKVVEKIIIIEEATQLKFKII